MAAFSSSSFHQLIVANSHYHHHHPQQSNNYNNIGAAVAFSHEFYQPAAETDLHQNNNIIDHHNFTTTTTNNNNNNISMDNSSSIVTAQNPTMGDKKRKLICSKDASNSPNSAQSKDMRGVKAGKKQRKSTKNGEEKKKLSKEKEKKLGDQKEGAPEGYIHVRARRGQATDSHSLAERVRRERISERLKLLQALVPGCDKVTGKALMLDEIINYVQSLQNQVEFLSMKLASVNPMYYDFGMELESFMVRSDQINLSSLASSPLQCCSPTTSNPNYPILNNSTSDHNSLMFQQPQIPNSLPLQQQQGHRQMWEMEDQRQKIINQAAGMISNTFFQFH